MTKNCSSDNFRSGFKILFFSQPVYSSLFAADEGANPETAGRIQRLRNNIIRPMH